MGTFKQSLTMYFHNAGATPNLVGSRICMLNVEENDVYTGSEETADVAKLLDFDDDYVDMGLPSGTLWARKNLGATKETDYGFYAAWGEKMAYENAAARNAALGRSDGFTTDAYQASSIGGNLTLENDAAHCLLGSTWKMPSTEQFAELFNALYTTNQWVTNYKGISGLNGRLLTSVANGNTLFFPAVGIYSGTSLSSIGSSGYYWSSSYVSATDAYRLYFNSSNVNPLSDGQRRYGFSIRPVK